MIGIISSDSSRFPFYHHCPVPMMAATTLYDTIRFDSMQQDSLTEGLMSSNSNIMSYPAFLQRHPGFHHYQGMTRTFTNVTCIWVKTGSDLTLACSLLH
jgi:hypothetical protein